MKHFVVNLFKTPMFLVFALITLIYAMPALGKQAELSRYAVVTAIGIDSVDEENSENKFEVSLLTFIPIAEQTFTETYKVISSQGRSVSEAMDLAGLHIGREIGLSHVKSVIMNTELLKEDVSKFLDYLSRSKNMAASTKLMATDSKAKDFLNAVQKLDSESSIKISEVINFNSDYIYSSDSSFETFFKGMFGPTKVSLVPFLSINDTEGGISVASGGEQSGGQESSNGGGQNSSTTSGQNEEIVNSGDTLIFKDGKVKTMLTGLDMKKINLIRGDYTTGSIEIKDYTDEIFDHAKLIFEIFGKSIQYKVKYENGIPIFYINTQMTLALSEVENEKGMVERNVEFFVIDQKCVNALENKIRRSIADALEIMRDNQTDIVDFYTFMNNSDKKAFNNFLDSLEDRDDYLNKIVFKIGVDILSK